jgi:phospholipid transport system substrate-binding protein
MNLNAGQTTSLSKVARPILLIVTCFIIVALSSLQGEAATCPGAATVKGAASALMSAARQNSLPAFRSALSSYANVRAIAMFALGKYQNKLRTSQRGEYVNSAHGYMSRFLRDNSDRFKTSAKVVIERCDGNLVETSLNGRSRMLWRVSGGRVQDLRVEGVWLGLQLRSKFVDIIRRNNGDVDALLQFLSGY